jgi:hypothetical protein
MFAQALVERGVLESAALTIADLAVQVGDAVATRTFVAILLVAALGVLLVWRR